ncbi:MAG TPA: HNH endonuclease signature motif containing protein [Burkholderiales bacterium]|nr:HNH endonuclease signature motif containing protein [Burkholderiales bacterium]
MAGEHRAWSLIVLPSEERQYKGNVGYEDDPAAVYRYDSNVANHLQVSAGDVALLRDRNHLLGIARIESIEEKPGTKQRLRCPVCNNVAIRQRKTERVPFRCTNGHVFEKPRQESVKVTLYAARYSKSFVPAKDAVPVAELKAAAFRPSDQMSIEEVDLRRLESSLLKRYPATADLISDFHQARAIDPDDALGDPRGETESEGKSPFVPSIGDSRDQVLRSIKARRGQRKFRRALQKRYGGKCMVAGCALMDIVEAAHIWPYRGEKDNHLENGLLLRADLHTLFDLNLMGIDPDSLRVYFAEAARKAGYGAMHGAPVLTQDGRRPSRDALAKRWKVFCEENHVD